MFCFVYKCFLSRGVKYLLLSTFLFFMVGCAASLPKPVDEKSAMLLVSVEAKRSLGSNKPDEVVITRKEDGRDFEYTGRHDKYYFFTNLPEGTYQIKTAKIIIKGNSLKTQSGNFTSTVNFSSLNVFNFTEQLVDFSATHVHAGGVAYMGSITAEGTARIFPPGSIDITNIEISKSKQDELEAWSYFKDKFSDSPWVDLID